MARIDSKPGLQGGARASTTGNAVVASWLAALDDRHLSDLTISEAARALRSLSSCYVERRSRLAGGGALDSRGKRAAFALFYGPLHYLVTRHVVRAVGAEALAVRHIADLGCGTGAAGAAWAIESGAPRIWGWDRNPWAVNEANWTWRTMGLGGRASQGDAVRLRKRDYSGAGILLAYVVNELGHESRAALLSGLRAAAARGARVLVVEPISRRLTPWWDEWLDAFESAGGRADEWRFPGSLPARQRELAKAAGLDPRELTAKSLWM